MATVTVEINGRPYALLVCAGSDGQNAARQMARIAEGLSSRMTCVVPWQAVAPVGAEALAALAPAPDQLLWDVGAGCGQRLGNGGADPAGAAGDESGETASFEETDGFGHNSGWLSVAG